MLAFIFVYNYFVLNSNKRQAINLREKNLGYFVENIAESDLQLQNMIVMFLINLFAHFYDDKIYIHGDNKQFFKKYIKTKENIKILRMFLNTWVLNTMQHHFKEIFAKF